MVCKKEVIAWFCDLTASRRIDFLCALMDCCSPLELRFLGTYVESLGRRDYDRLRESELHANDVSYLSKLTNITDIRILDKVLTSLALMNSRCTDGASVLYRTLKDHTDAILSNGFRTRHHTETDEKVVLLAVIAVNHPAFTFSQKQALRSQLYALLSAVESKVVPEMDEVEDNPNTTDNVTSKDNKEQLMSASTSNSDNRDGDKVNHSQESTPVHIKAIEVKGLINRQSDKRLEYTFQVHWSDSTISCVSKTHAQLFDFQCKLVQLFPDEASTEQHQDRVIPYIPGKRIFSMTPPGEQGEKTQTEIVEYTKQLSALPQHILQCEHVSQFFSSNLCEGSGMQPDATSHHTSLSPIVPPADKPKPALPPPAPHQLPTLVTNQVDLNKQLEQFAAGINKTQVFPAALAQMQQSIQPHSMQQALQHQPSIHLRHPQPQQFPNVHMQQQQQQHVKGHISPHPHISPQHPHMQMQSHAHIQLQQQVQQHTQQQQQQHHHHPQQLLSPGNPQLQQQLPPPPPPQQQQLHQPPPPPGTPTHNLTASINQLHISQHHHQVNLPATGQPHNSSVPSGEGGNNTNGGGGNMSMPSNNNSMVTGTVTTTSAGNNSVYYQTVSSMVFVPSPSEQYTNAGSNSDPVSVSQPSFKPVQPKPPQNWPQSFNPPGNPPTHTASLYASAPSTTHMCISPLQSPIFRYPVPQAGLVPSSRDSVAPIIHEWLKKQRLHKYASLFEGMTFDQVLKLSDDHIDRWNIVKGAKGRIKTQLEQLRKNDVHLYNGMSPQAMGMHPMTHGFFMSPPPPGAAGTIMPQMAAAHIVSLQHQQQQHLHGGEATSSECSSPPSSPRDSSDENDRDSEESESSATSCAEVIPIQAKRKEALATGMQSPLQTSPREQASKNGNQPSATSLPYSQVVKSVGVDAGRQGDRSPIPPGEARSVAPPAGTLISPMQQQPNDPQQQHLQLQKPHMQQSPQMQVRMNAMPSQPLPPPPPSNTVVIGGKQLPQVLSPEGSSPQLHQLDSPVIAAAGFTPHMFHIKQGNNKQSVHTVQYIQGDGEGVGAFRTSKVVVQQAVGGARGSLASPSPPIPAGTLQTRSDIPIPVMPQNAPTQEQVNPPSSKTVNTPVPIQLVPKPLPSLGIPLTDGYIAPTSVTYVTASKQSMAVSSDITPCNNNLSSYNSCTSCGCNGQCGQANHQTSTSAPSSNSSGSNNSTSSSGNTSSHLIHFNHPTTYIASPGQLNFQTNFYHQTNMMPPGTPNSMMNAPPPPPHNLPPSNSPRYHPPIPPSPLPGGMPDMMYGGNPQFGIMPPGAQMYLSGLGMGHRGHGVHTGGGGGGSGGSKKGQITCFNCGGQGHRASECREATMESITHNSHYRLNYKSLTSDTTEGSSDS